MYAIHAIRILCESQKERGSDELHNFVRRSMDAGKLPQIPDYALDMHTQRGQQMGRDYLHFLEEAAKVAPET